MVLTFQKSFRLGRGLLVVLFGGALTPTAAGKAYLLVQALAVAALAEMQWTALRRLPAGA